MNILNEITNAKRKWVAIKKQQMPYSQLERMLYFNRTPILLSDQINKLKGKAVIAEFKRKSPSKGIINSNVDIIEITTGYAHAGVAGISILTDEPYFSGKDEDLTRARKLIPSIPILRKDFIIDEYQIYEAKAIGADVILLIAGCLSTYELKNYAKLAQNLKLEIIYEVHSPDEIDKLPAEALIVGINNRNLKNFEVNIEHSINMLKKLPTDCLKVAESGIDSPDTAKKLAKIGFDAFLIGEYFMKQNNPVHTCETFIKALTL